MEPRDPRVTKNAYFSLLKHTKQLLAVRFCKRLEIVYGHTNRKTETLSDGETDVENEIII